MFFESIELAQSGSQDAEATAFLVWLVPVLLIIGIVNLVGAIKRRGRLAAFAGGVTPVRDLGKTEGTAVVEGTAVANEPLISPITKTPCVYCAYSVEEEWRRDWTEREKVPVHHERKDLYGNVEIQTEHREVVHARSKVGTRVIAKDSRSTPFQVRDATGEVLVVPERAQITGQNFEDVVDRSSPMYEVPGVREQRGSTGHRKLEEEIVPVGAEVTVVGPVEQENGTPRVRWSSGRRPGSRNPFVVTMQRASDAAQSEHAGMIRRFVIAGACLVASVAIIVVFGQGSSSSDQGSSRPDRPERQIECVEQADGDVAKLERCLSR